MWRVLSAVVLVILGFAATASTPARAVDRPVFFAALSGRNEVPPNNSRGFGLAVFVRQHQSASIEYRLFTVLTENITQAHIHCGAEGVNGPVVAFLFGPASPPVDSNGQLARGTIDAADVVAVPNSPACPGGVASLRDLLAKMEMGLAYVNVHTTAFPGGQIRGQIR
jgi:hypothetical protein